VQPHLVTAGFQHLSPLALHFAVQRRVLPDFTYGRGMASRETQILRSKLSGACNSADREPFRVTPLDATRELTAIPIDRITAV
jgi:hypothetical protein